MQNLIQLLPYLIVAAAIIWIAKSPDPLAEVIRVRVLQMKSQATRRLDSAVAREEAELARLKKAKANGNKVLIEMKDARNALRNQVAWFDTESGKMDTAAKNLATVSDQAGVEDAMKRQDDLETDSGPVKERLEKAETAVRNKERRMAELDAIIKDQESKVADAKLRSGTAKGAEVDEIIAGLEDSENHQKAEEILREEEAHADTMREMADHVIEARRARAKLDVYSQGVPEQKAPVSDRAAALIASMKKN